MLLCAVPIVFEQVATDHREVFEDAEPEREQRDIVEIDAEAIADKDERGGKQGIREKPRDKDVLVEPLRDRRAQSAESGVERGDERNGEEFGIGERNHDGAHIADEETDEDADQDDVDHVIPPSSLWFHAHRSGGCSRDTAGYIRRRSP